MAVKLEGTISRFIGLSNDIKPITESDEPPARHIAPGSTFLESDTGRIYRWDGRNWMYPDEVDASVSLLGAIYQELYRLRILYEGSLINQS